MDLKIEERGRVLRGRVTIALRRAGQALRGRVAMALRIFPWFIITWVVSFPWITQS